MKFSKNIFMFLILLFNSLSFAEELANTPQPELVEEGTLLLNEEKTPEDFLAFAKKLREDRGFTKSDQQYLKNLSLKLPLEKSRSICSPMEDSLCQNSVNRKNDFESQKFAISDERAPLRTEKFIEDSFWQSNAPYWLGAGLLLTVAYLSLRDKEIQIQWRSLGW